MLDKRITFNTENGRAVLKTDLIQGVLTAIILESDVEMSVMILSDKGYLVFHENQHLGVKYYAPRARLQEPKQNLLTPTQFDKFSLNESLDIIVDGQKNKELVMTLRFD